MRASAAILYADNVFILTFVYFCYGSKTGCNNPCADYPTARVVVPTHLNNGANPSQKNLAVPEMGLPFFFIERSRILSCAIRCKRPSFTTTVRTMHY